MERKKLDWAIGIDVGGSFIKYGLVNNQGQVIGFNQKTTPKTLSPFKILIKEIIRKLSKIKSVCGIGVGMPGLIDLKKQRVIYLPHLPEISKLNLVKFIEKRFDFPCLIDNDAHCFLIGKLIFEKIYKNKTVVLLTLGTGTGSAIAIKGKMYSGNKITSAGFGEMIINLDGEKCTCGRQGCLNAYLGEAIRQKNTNLNTYELLNKACHGNTMAKQVFNQMGQKLGIGCANIINLLRPDYLVITGGCGKCFKYLKQHFYRSLKKNIFGNSTDIKTVIKISNECIKGGVKGAGGLMIGGKKIYLN